MNKAFIDNSVVTVVETRDISNCYTPEVCEMFIDCPDWVKEGDSYINGGFIKTDAPTEKSTEERLLLLEEENARLKEQLEVQEDALNFLIMGGEVIG